MLLLVGTYDPFHRVRSPDRDQGARRRGSAFDTGSLLGSLTLYSMPEGWLGMILLIPFAGVLGWFPPQYESTEQLTGFAHRRCGEAPLPPGPHADARLPRGVRDHAVVAPRGDGEEFVRTARAQGVRDKDVRRRHAVPNALLPTFTLAFYSFGFILGGAVIIEEVFSWPGSASSRTRRSRATDYPVIQAVFLLSSAAVILFNLLADIMYGYLDPRVKEA